MNLSALPLLVLPAAAPSGAAAAGGTTKGQRAGMRALALTTSHPVDELQHFLHLIGLTADYRGLSLAGVLDGRL